MFLSHTEEYNENILCAAAAAVLYTRPPPTKHPPRAHARTHTHTQSRNDAPEQTSPPHRRCRPEPPQLIIIKRRFSAPFARAQAGGKRWRRVCAGVCGCVSECVCAYSRRGNSHSLLLGTVLFAHHRTIGRLGGDGDTQHQLHPTPCRQRQKPP